MRSPLATSPRPLATLAAQTRAVQGVRHRSPASGDEPPPPPCHQSTSPPPPDRRTGSTALGSTVNGAPASPPRLRLAPTMQGRGAGTRTIQQQSKLPATSHEYISFSYLIYSTSAVLVA